LDKDAWRAANPALGTIASEAYVEQLANEAKRLPSRESQFRNLVLNQRVSLRRHLIPMEVWKANGGYPEPNVFEERPVYGGLDLSSRLDLTALVLVARDAEFRWHVDAHFWTPADTLHERALRDRAPYDQWERAGLLTAVPGKSIDCRWVAERIGEIAKSCDLRVIAFDRWRIDDLKRELEEKEILLANSVGHGWQSAHRASGSGPVARETAASPSAR
jgi:phage terminase large subunit-like protein